MSEEETVTAAEEVDVEETPEVIPDTPEGDEEAVSEEGKPEEGKPDPKIAEESFKKRAARRSEREMQALRRQVEDLTRAIETQSRSISKTQEPKPPKIDDYETIDEYVDAKLEYKLNQGKAEESTEIQEPAFDTSELYQYGTDKYEDFAEVVGAEDVRITPVMANAILEIDDPDLQVDVAYLLGTDTKEASRISKLSPVRQIAAIAKLEDKLTNKPTAQKRTSAAPAPIKPVSGTKTTTSEIRPDDDFETFMKKRNKQLGRL